MTRRSKLLWSASWLLASWLASVSIGRAGAPQYYYIWNNSLHYESVPAQSPDLSPYQALIWRAGHWYQSRVSETLYLPKERIIATGTSRLYPESPANNYYELKNQYQQGFLRIQLQPAEWDFANFSFAYAIVKSSLGQTYRSLPFLTINVCGQDNLITLPQETVSSSYRILALPNPGTCDAEHDLIEIMPATWGNDYGWLTVRLSQFSLNVVRRADEEIMVLRRQDGQPLAHVGLVDGQQTVVCQASECYLTTEDQPWVGELDEEGLIANLGTYGDYLPYTQPNAYNQNFTLALDQLNGEEDGSLTALVRTDNFALGVDQAVGITLAVAPQAEQLWSDWTELASSENNGRAGYRGLAYLLRQATQAINFSLPAEVDWTTGFFAAARLHDAWGQAGPLSNIYYCQAGTCQEVAAPDPATVLIEQITWRDETPRLSLRVLDASVDLADYILTDDREAGVRLSDGELIGDQIVMANPDLNLSRPSIHLTLYANGEVVDTVNQTGLSAPLSVRRDLVTRQWRLVYVRD